MPNRLSREKSPYLLQHSENPVDWYPWGEEAFMTALREDKPIFLSIGYATCHWCHVMERESFEDEELAKLLNDHLVSIKVDREERPDIDRIYMTVCQVLTGRGGWPLSIFMTPERKPFFAGTYFPKSGKMGLPGFTDIIRQVAHLWKNDRNRLFQAGEQVAAAIQPKGTATVEESLDPAILETAFKQLVRSFDDKWGGFGRSPKFPTAHNLTFLLRWHRRTSDTRALVMVEKTLDAMRSGGIFDQIGFGFHRYSVDERWFVPHFEKMLHDQALLAILYTEAFQVTGRVRHARVAGEILDYVLRDMTDSAGGFYSAEDADSEGKEGLFYLWTAGEVKAALGQERGDLFCRFFDITAAGNFEGNSNIPHIFKPTDVFANMVGMSRNRVEDQIEEDRQKLFAIREKRIHPLKDDKILTSWNGLMIAALSNGYKALRNDAYATAASKAANFLLESMYPDSKRLFRRYRHGEVAIPGYVDDYAFLVWGLIELYEATFNTGYLEKALEINKQMIDLFWDEQNGGLFFTASDGEDLIVRDKETQDTAVPSSNSVAALNFLRLAGMTGDSSLAEKADRLFKVFPSQIADYPSAYTQFLCAVDFALGPRQEVVIAGNLTDQTTRDMMELCHKTFNPGRVLMLKQPGEEGERLTRISEYTNGLATVDNRPTVYVCENYACKQPITDLDKLEASLITG